MIYRIYGDVQTPKIKITGYLERFRTDCGVFCLFERQTFVPSFKIPADEYSMQSITKINFTSNICMLKNWFMLNQWLGFSAF